MLCFDCPQLDRESMLAKWPDWEPRALCCSSAPDQIEAAKGEAFENTWGPSANTPQPRVLNRRERRAQASKGRR